jgi:hypothetical protein
MSAYYCNVGSHVSYNYTGLFSMIMGIFQSSEREEETLAKIRRTRGVFKPYFQLSQESRGERNNKLLTITMPAL